MRAQHQALQARRPIAFVSDTACDLPDELVLQYDIKLVPTQLIVDERPYRGRLELTSAEFFQRRSQPPRPSLTHFAMPLVQETT